MSFDPWAAWRTQSLWVQQNMQLLYVQRYSKSLGLKRNLWCSYLPCHTFFLSLTSAFLNGCGCSFLQILAPSLLILQVHWISEWREKKPQWLAQSFLATCVRRSPEDEVQCCGVLRGRCLRKLWRLSLCVWIVFLWIFFAWGHSHPQVLSCIFFLWWFSWICIAIYGLSWFMSY